MRGRAQQILYNRRAEAAAVAVEMLDVGVIFAFKQFLLTILEGLGHTILFPIAAIMSLIRAILAIREVYLIPGKNKNKKGIILRASVETVAALAIGIAVLGSLTLAFGPAGPIIFTATLGFKTLYHLGSTIFYLRKAASTQDKDQKAAYIQKAESNFVLTCLTGVTTLAVGLVFVADLASFGLLGMLSTGLSAAYAIYKAYRPAAGGGAAARMTARSSTTLDVSDGLGEHLLQPMPRNVPAPPPGLLSPSPSDNGIRYVDALTETEKEALITVKDNIFKEWKKYTDHLEELSKIPEIGAQNIFQPGKIANHVMYTPLIDVWWKNLYGNEELKVRLSHEQRELMKNTDAALMEHNRLISENQALLLKETNIDPEEHQAQVQKRNLAWKAEEEARELRNKRLQRDTGWGSTEEATAFSNAANLGGHRNSSGFG